MQKWRAVLLGILGICVVLGVFIGMFLRKSGIGSIKISRLSIFEVVELICLVIVIICAIFDFLKIRKDKKKFGKLRNSITNLKAGRTRFGLIGITSVVIFELVIFGISPSVSMFIMFLMVVVPAFMFFYHNIQKNGVNENGIFFWGVFFLWKQVKGYIAKEPDQIDIVVIQKVGSNFDNKISLKIKIDEYGDVLRAFSEGVLVKEL